MENIEEMLSIAKQYKKCKERECGKVDVKAKFHGNMCMKCYRELSKPMMKQWYIDNAQRLKMKREQIKLI